MNHRPYIWLLVPCLFILLATVYIPILMTFGYSLYHYVLTEPSATHFIGVGNYIQIFLDANFHASLLNTLCILILLLAGGISLSIGTALILKRRTKITPLLTALTIIPWALPPLVNGILWKFIVLPGAGLLNILLLNLGVIANPIAWTSNRWSLLCIVSFVVIWRSVPFGAILLLAALERIPQSYYDAIYLDGATPWQGFTRITLPLLKPAILLLTVTLLTTAVDVFDEVIALSGYTTTGQPLAVYTYMTTFNFLDFGTGSAASYIMMLGTGLIGYFYIRFMKKVALH